MGLEVQATMLGSTLVEFKVGYQHSKHLDIGDAVHSETIYAGGHMWRMNCYSSGVRERDMGQHVSLFLELLNKSSSVEAIFGAWLKGNGRQNSTSAKRTLAYVFNEEEDELDEQGWHRFCSQTEIEDYHVTEGYITFVCAIMVVSGNSISVPPSDLGEHLGRLLNGTDVSFNVDGETFHAHRAVLAARSPVFHVGLLGSMAEATMPAITLHDQPSPYMTLPLQFSESCFGSCTLTRCPEMTNSGPLPSRRCSIY
jgi:speckle-type POZ protein